MLTGNSFVIEYTGAMKMKNGFVVVDVLFLQSFTLQPRLCGISCLDKPGLELTFSSCLSFPSGGITNTKTLTVLCNDIDLSM